MVDISVIFPVAHDLRWDNRMEEVACGPGTVASCDHAVKIFLDCKQKNQDARLIATASEAPRFNNVEMGRVMAAYMSNSVLDPEYRACVEYRKAEEFNTLGELIALAHYVQELEQKEGRGAVGVVYITVKGWHAQRVDILARHIFEHSELGHTPIVVKTHKAFGWPWDKLAESLKTRRQLAEFDRRRMAAIQQKMARAA